jgi:excisionase family DNA binding protein
MKKSEGALAASYEARPVALRVDDAASALGVSPRTVWSLVRNGSLPALRIGTRILIPYNDLQDFVTSRADRTGAHVRPESADRVAQANRSRGSRGTTV